MANHRSLMRLISGIMLAVLTGLVGLIGALPAAAQVPFVQADFRGFATGAVMHADLLQTGTDTEGTRVLNSETAFSGATTDSKGLTSQLLTENAVVVNNALQGKNAFARGSGFEAGAFENTPINPNDYILYGLSDSDAPPDSSDKQELAVALDPAIYSSTLRGESAANWNIEGCVLGDDISRGVGYAEDLQLLDTDLAATPPDSLESPAISLSSNNPDRAWSQTLSRTRLVPQTAADGTVSGPAFGLSSQVRTTIAPITLFKGTQSQITIEIMGEWVLTATATGLNGGAYIHYGPLDDTPDVPILRTLDSAGNETRFFTLQQITGPEGLVVPLPFGEIVIGEDPRAISGDASSAPLTEANGTKAAAAVDVARLVIDGGLQATDLRFGHMEVSAQVPAGGIACGIKVTKTADKQQVKANDEFTYTVVVHNTFDCILTDVKLVDTITTTPGVTYTLVSENPTATSKTGNTLNFTVAEPMQPGTTREFAIKVKVNPDSAAGTMTNKAVATAICGLSAAQAGVDVNTNVVGEVTINVPEVTAADRVLAATGDYDRRLWAGAIMLALAGAAAVGSRHRSTKTI